MSLLHPLSPDPDNAAPIIGLDPSLAKAGKVVAVVVTHNRFAQLKQTISALLAVPLPFLQGIVVVDNGSDDGSWGWLSSVQDARIMPLRHSKNLGGAGGFHAGLRAAVSLMDPDWVVVMDDDGRPDDGAIAAFHQTDLSGWDMVAAAVRYPDGAICEMNRPSRNPFWSVGAFWATVRRGRSGFHIDPAHYAYGMPPVQVDVSSFVGLFISRKTIDLIGYPDPSLFVYGEDGLYTLAASKAGLRIGFFRIFASRMIAPPLWRGTVPSLRFGRRITTTAICFISIARRRGFGSGPRLGLSCRNGCGGSRGKSMVAVGLP